MDDAGMAKTETESAATKLKALFDRTGQSQDAFAKRAGYGFASGIQRYINPQQYKKRYFSIEIAEKLGTGLVGLGAPPITKDEVLWELAGVRVSPDGQFYKAPNGSPAINTENSVSETSSVNHDTETNARIASLEAPDFKRFSKDIPVY